MELNELRVGVPSRTDSTRRRFAGLPEGLRAPAASSRSRAADGRFCEGLDPRRPRDGGPRTVLRPARSAFDANAAPGRRPGRRPGARRWVRARGGGRLGPRDPARDVRAPGGPVGADPGGGVPGRRAAGRGRAGPAARARRPRAGRGGGLPRGAWWTRWSTTRGKPSPGTRAGCCGPIPIAQGEAKALATVLGPDYPTAARARFEALLASPTTRTRLAGARP